MRRQIKDSECRVCRVLGQHRVDQKRLPNEGADEDRLAADMIELTLLFDRYSNNRVAALLRDAGWQLNDKRDESL